MRVLFSIMVVIGSFSFGSCKQEICNDTCYWPADGQCDDGGEDSITDYCDFGTDCTDCGARTE